MLCFYKPYELRDFEKKKKKKKEKKKEQKEDIKK